jgi:hypothetical protein
MAYSNPNIPTVDIQQQEPVGLKLVTFGTVLGIPPAGATYADIFALECLLQDIEGGTGTYEQTGTVAVPQWTLITPAGNAPGAPVNSVQVNGAGTFTGSAAFTYVPGTHPTQNALTVGTTGDNGKIWAYAENVSSRAMRGLSFVGGVVNNYEGVFSNDQFDSPGVGLLKQRVIYGSNEDLDLELQGSHAVLISATDDVYGVGYVKISANAGVQIMPYASGDTVPAQYLRVTRVSEAAFGAANTSEVGVQVASKVGTVPGCLHLNLGSTTGAVGFPNLTQVQKQAITVKIVGSVVFDTTLNKLCVYTGEAGGASTGWETITSVLE